MSPEHLIRRSKAQEQLLQLKRQAEQTEKQKRELEVSRRREELKGPRGVTDASRSLVIPNEGYDLKKLEIRHHESFTSIPVARID